MPSLLIEAYGTSFAQKLSPRNLGTKAVATEAVVTAVDAANAADAIDAIDATDARKSDIAAAHTVVETRPKLTENAGRGQGNYEIHITIDRHDCHLLCLFIGVFTLSVLFNSNKRGPTA